MIVYSCPLNNKNKSIDIEKTPKSCISKLGYKPKAQPQE